MPKFDMTDAQMADIAAFLHNAITATTRAGVTAH
jgi:hypothetical protein